MSFTVNLHEQTRNIQENIVNHPIRLIAIIPLIFVFISCSGNSNLDNLSGNIPIDPEVGKYGDLGKPIVESETEHKISKIYLRLAEKIKRIYF